MNRIILTAAILFAAAATYAQQEVYPADAEALSKKIIAMDTEAFDAYNTCNLEKFSTYFTSDLEFYHDKGGATTGIEKFIENTQKYICNSPDGRIIRKPAAGTFKVYALEGYGAILVGGHDFYIVNNGVEKKTGSAKFTHVWLLKDGRWKMARVLSYDHKAAQ